MNSKSLYKPPFHVSPKIDRVPNSKIVQPLIYTGATSGPISKSYLRRKHIDSLNAADQFLQTREAFISLGLTLGENYKRPEFQNIMFNRGNEESGEEKIVIERKLTDAKNAEIIKNAKPPKKSFIMKSRKLIQNDERPNDKKYENFEEFTERILLKSKGNISSDDEEHETYGRPSSPSTMTVRSRFGKLDFDMTDTVGKGKSLKWVFPNSGITDATIRKKVRDEEKRVQRWPKKSQNNVDNFDPMLNIDKILRQGASLLEESSRIRPRIPGEEDHFPGRQTSFDDHYFQDFKPSIVPESHDPSAFYPTVSTATTSRNVKNPPVSTAATSRSVKFNKSKTGEGNDKRKDPINRRSDDNQTTSSYRETVLKPLTPVSKPWTVTSGKPGKNAGPFDGLKISSLVANGAAKILGYQGKAKDYEDVMNPIQQQLVEEMADYELSSFLPKGHGHRPPKRGLRIFEPIKTKAKGETNADPHSGTMEKELKEAQPSWIKFKKYSGKYKSRPTQPKISPGLALTTAAMKQAELRAQRMQHRQVYVEHPVNRKPQHQDKDVYVKKALREAAAEDPSEFFTRIPFTTGGIGKYGRMEESIAVKQRKSNIGHLSTANFDLKTKSEIVRRPGIRY